MRIRKVKAPIILSYFEKEEEKVKNCYCIAQMEREPELEN
jgi:hypothetical protein